MTLDPTRIQGIVADVLDQLERGSAAPGGALAAAPPEGLVAIGCW